MRINIRKFEKKDITNKIRWINDPENNTFLHYDLPLEREKTEEWFEKNKDRKDRYDAIIEANGIPVGIIGLLSIDYKKKKAEYYVTLGEREYLGKGVANRASKLLLNYAFTELGLNKIYLYVEKENIPAIKSYERIGFKCEGLINNDIFNRGRFVDRYIYGIEKKDFYCKKDTPIQMLHEIGGNKLYIKRDDFVPFSFGGNKARKAELFFREIDCGDFDCVVTYGSGSSNHCRVVANMAAARNMPCYIISPKETFKETYNSKMVKLFGASFLICNVEEVADTIDRKMSELKKNGHKPYFIAGGGHGNIGTQAYVDCYDEILNFEKENNVKFDYIFHASGTGTTQAGMVCGQLINGDNRQIIGISIARRNPKGRDIVVESVKDYMASKNIYIPEEIIEKKIIFVDDYVGSGYGVGSDKIEKVIRMMMVKEGIPLDSTYTGKALTGMVDYIDENKIEGKTILFIHTGGTPLFFDEIRGTENEF